MNYPLKNRISDLYFQIWIEAGQPEGWFQIRNEIRAAVGTPEEQQQRVEQIRTENSSLLHLCRKYSELQKINSDTT